MARQGVAMQGRYACNCSLPTRRKVWRNSAPRKAFRAIYAFTRWSRPVSKLPTMPAPLLAAKPAGRLRIQRGHGAPDRNRTCI